jgi:hypothetical protein
MQLFFCQVVGRIALPHKYIRHAKTAGEPFVVLDDNESGTGLRASRHYKAGRVVLCEGGAGLQTKHLPVIRKALTH